MIYDSCRVNLSTIMFGNALFNLNVLLKDEISRFHTRFLIRNYDGRNHLCLGANWLEAKVEEVSEASCYASMSELMFSYFVVVESLSVFRIFCLIAQMPPFFFSSSLS